MKKYKVGDRVKVYGTVHGGNLPDRKYAYYTNGTQGRVTVITCDTEIYVRFDAKEVLFRGSNLGKTALSGYTALVHPKQCRRLKKAGAK